MTKEERHNSFKSQFAGSHLAVYVVAHYLRKKRYKVTLDGFAVRDSLNQSRQGFSDDGDILLTDSKGQEFRVEVRHRTLDFRNTGFKDVYFAPVGRHHESQPDMYFIVNNDCSEAIFQWGKNIGEWVVKEGVVDGNNVKKDTYAVVLGKVKPSDWLDLSQAFTQSS